MFGKLKEKLKSFLGKKEETEEKPVKEVVEKPSKKEPTKEAKKSEKKPLQKKEISKSSSVPKELPTEEELKEQAEKIKESVPVKFEVGQEQFIPDEESIKEKYESETKKSEEPGIADKEPEEEPKKPSFLSKFTKSVLTQTQTLKEEHVDEIFEPLELILLENNVALEVVDKIRENLKKDLIGIEVKKTQIEETITSSLKESISSVLLEPPNLIEQIKSTLNPYTIIFFGINGSGKTTSIAKLAHKLKENKISCVLAAADTFRAAAIQQLETHASRLKLPIIKHDYGSDPTAVAFDAVKYAQKNKIQCVLVDTAGRMYTKENLVKQMEKIIRVIKPDLKIFVGESIAGNDAVEQVKTFNEAVGIDGIILSKADVDEKGGTALSVSQITKKPIYFLGTGQEYKDFQEFKKKTIIEGLGLN